jgi:hypothetical protein
MCVGDGDVPAPQHLPVRSCKRGSSILITRVLYERIAAGLAAQRASLMKEVVEAHEFAKLGEDLDESVFIHGRMKITDV